MNAPEPTAAPRPLFRSFFLAGYESACHINPSGRRLDMIAATQHDVQVADDYALLRSVGIQAARDALRWPLIDRGGVFDFTSFAPMLNAAKEQRIQVIWTLCHYGWPDDVDVFSSTFVKRFARFCAATARFVADQTSDTPFYTPINEISFLTWAMGHRGMILPLAIGRAEELKRQLVRATIAGCDAIWEVDPRARFIHGDPIIHVVAPPARPDLADAAALQRAAQFHTWDLLAGRLEPELGGHPRYLDVIGLHYYHGNQWEYPDVRLRWEDTPRDPRWFALSKHLIEIHERYRRPVFIGETSHFGVGRAAWLRETVSEVKKAIQFGVPVEGICLFPIIDRHDWDNLEHWHHSGLWELTFDQGILRRVLNPDYAQELRQSQMHLASFASR